MAAQNSQEFRYFAYGSNLHPLRLEERVGPVKLAGVGALGGYRLRFNKRGRDGSAKGNIERTIAPGGPVLGCLYLLTRDQRSTLDSYESLGTGYERFTVQVKNQAETVSAFTYCAMPAFVDDALHPFDWYVALVRLGARHHQFPAEYLRRLDEHPAQNDADRHRADRHAELIARIAGTVASSGTAGF